MTIIDSSMGGPLLPDPSTDPPLGISFEDFMQQVVAGITGLPAPLVRPRWQPEAPNMPDAGTDWIAFGMQQTDSDDYPAVLHTDGVDTLYRDEEFDLMGSFFGTKAEYYAKTLRDGLLIQTNLDVLRQAGVAFVSAGSLIRAPSLVKELWLNKFDMTLHFRRRITRTYPVLNLEIGGILLLTDVGISSAINL